MKKKIPLTVLMLLLLNSILFPLGRISADEPLSLPEEASPQPTAAITSNLMLLDYTVSLPEDPLAKELRPDQAFNLRLHFKNSGILTQQLSSANDLDITKMLDGFEAGTQSAPVILSSLEQPLEFMIDFNGLKYKGNQKTFSYSIYYRNLGITQDSGNLEITECLPRAVSLPAPSAQINRAPLQPVSAGQEFSVKLTVQNTGASTMKTPQLSLALSDALILKDSSNCRTLKDLAAGQSETMEIKLKAIQQITNEIQYLETELKFTYDNGTQLESGSASARISIPVVITKEKSSTEQAAPNLILNHVDYGKKAIAAGTAFDLNLNFQNTSQNLAIENIVMTLEPQDGLSMDASTNTFYFSSLPAAKSTGKKIKMQVSPSCRTNTVSTAIHFKYEYVEGEKRISAVSTQNLSIPIYQMDRLEFTLESFPEQIESGMEQTLILNYVNRGKSEVSNVQAELSGEVDCLNKIQNLGNFESGKSGSIYFAITPQEVKETTVTILISYEDANQESKTLTFPVKFTVTDPEFFLDETFEEPDSKPSSAGFWVVAIAAAFSVSALAAGGALLFIRKKKAQLHQADTLWSDDDEMA